MRFEDLKALKHWVCYRVEIQNGRKTKVPYSALTGVKTGANIDHESEWVLYDDAKVAAADKKNNYDGVGFVFTEDLGLVGIDIDHMIDDDTRDIKLYAQKIIDVVDSYTETSRSGKGIHIIAKGTPVSTKGVHNDLVEIYSTGRYFVVTEKMLGCNDDIRECGEVLNDLYKCFDVNYPLLKKELLQNKALSKLWNTNFKTNHKVDKSSVDHALCKELLKFTHGDKFSTDMFMRMSSPVNSRDKLKWDEPKHRGSDGATYGQCTIDECIAEIEIEYEPFKDRVSDPTFFKEITGQLIAKKCTELAQLLIERYSICKIGDLVHMYDNGVYVSDRDRINAVINHELIVGDPNEIDKVYSKIYNLCTRCVVSEGVEKQLSPPNYILLENGVYNTDTKHLEQFRDDIVVLSKIPTEYHTDAYDKAVDNALNQWACGDTSVRALLEEMIGTCLYRKNFTRKMFILVGDKRNGKSTFLELICSMMGEDNRIVCDLQDMDKETNIAPFYSKLLCINDDMGDTFIPNTGIIKSLVSGGDVKGRELYGKPFYFQNYATMLFCANKIPRITDKNEAVTDRFIIIPFNAHFTKDVAGFKETLMTKSGKEYLLKLAIDGLHRVLENGFTHCDLAEQELHEYRLENDPILQFIEEVGEAKIVGNSTTDVFKIYQLFCAEQQISLAVKQKTLTDELVRRLQLTVKKTNVKKNNKVITSRIYLK